MTTTGTGISEAFPRIARMMPALVVFWKLPGLRRGGVQLVHCSGANGAQREPMKGNF